jgi:hemoglobin-like flavoprotein
MSPETKALLKISWAMVAPIGDTAATLFYERLFTLDPSLRRLFKNADMKQQRRKLLQALAAVINGVDNLPSLVPTLEALGRNHVRYGVTDQHLRHRWRSFALDPGAGPKRGLDTRSEVRVDCRLRHRGGSYAQRCG